MAHATSVENARDLASERIAEGHSVFYCSHLNYETVIDDVIEAVEEEGWSLEKMTVWETSWYGLFRRV